MSKGEIFYCTQCGKKHEAEDICFNLLEILDWDLRGVSVDFVPFGWEDMERLARENNTTLREGQLTELKLRLDVFMKLLSQIDEYAKKDFDYARMNIEDFLEGKNWPFRIKNQTKELEDKDENKIGKLAVFLADNFHDLSGKTLDSNYNEYRQTIEEEQIENKNVMEAEEMNGLKKEKEKIENRLYRIIEEYENAREAYDNVEMELKRFKLSLDEGNIDGFDEGNLKIKEEKVEEAKQTLRIKETLRNDASDALNSINAKIVQKQEEINKEKHELQISPLNLTQFLVEIYIQPEFIDGTDILYTIHFLRKGEQTSTIRHCMFMNRNIRGYCTDCHNPIIEEAGKYPHYLVGFLGKQSAGKTTLFISMIEEALGIKKIDIFEKKIGIRETALLVDGQYENLYRAMKLYQKGWAVSKTDKNAETGFNASVQLKMSNDRKVILTFVDIAGESFYDKRSHTIDTNTAYTNHPLILECQLYALCTCLETNDTDEMPANDLRVIMDDIYSRRKLRGNKNIAPMCLIIGKSDLFDDKETEGEEEKGKKFSYKAAQSIMELCSKIKAQEWLNVDGEKFENQDVYNLHDDLQNIVRLLEDYDKDITVKNVITYIYSTYHKFERTMYMSMILCSSLGKISEELMKKGLSYPDEAEKNTDGEIEKKITINTNSLSENRKHEWDKKLEEKDRFKVNTEGSVPVVFSPKRITHVWDWILKSLGITNVASKCRFQYIPSYGESYRFDTVEGGNINGHRTVYLYSDLDERTCAVYNMYLNPSEHDYELWRLKYEFEQNLEDCESHLNLAQKIFEKVRRYSDKLRKDYEKEKKKIVLDYRNTKK